MHLPVTEIRYAKLKRINTKLKNAHNFICCTTIHCHVELIFVLLHAFIVCKEMKNVLCALLLFFLFTWTCACHHFTCQHSKYSSLLFIYAARIFATVTIIAIWRIVFFIYFSFFHFAFSLCVCAISWFTVYILHSVVSGEYVLFSSFHCIIHRKIREIKAKT